jgi:AraC-like DNA-binding protein
LVTELIYSVSIVSRGETARQATVSHPILSEALAYINENLLTLKSISEIAERLFVTEGYLFRLFKTELRQTPRRYITDKRLLLARAMILGGERPTDVYAKCGFADYATFYRNYKLFFKRSPSDDVER